MLSLEWIRQKLGLDGSDEAEIAGVCTDSRALSPGQMFAALNGPHFDGHDFVIQALAAGAGAALVKESFAPENNDSRLLRVSDPLTALGDLAAAWRREHSLRVLALTGSNGKTTGKEMLAAILGLRYQVLKTEGNYNNLIGLPLTLFRLTGQHNAAVLEMGMSLPGEIARLTEIADPEVGIITNIGPAHLQTMGSLKNIAKAKSELWETMDSAAQAVINIDDALLKPWQGRLKGRCITFSCAKGADVWSSQIEVQATGQNFLLHLPGSQPRRVHLAVPGVHNIHNALAAAAAAFSLDMSKEEIAQGLSDYQGIKGRLRLLQTPDGALLLDDSYNANPASMAAALDCLRQLAAGEPGLGRRPVAVLADMLELGPQSEQFHYQAGQKAAENGCELLLTYGLQSRATAEGARQAGLEASMNFQDIMALKAALKKYLTGKDIVLVKGSNAMNMEQIVNFLIR